MIRLLFIVTLWLAIGHAVAGLLGWALLNVPESNAFMLALSGLLVVAIFLVVAAVNITAVGLLRPGGTWRSAVARIPRALPAVVVALLVMAVCWWLSERVGGWMHQHHGEIDAWLMLKFGWTRTTVLHRTIDWVIWILRYVLPGSLGLTVVAHATEDGLAVFSRRRWFNQAIAPSQLLLLGLGWWLLIVLPWEYLAYWRPAGVPPTSVQVVFAAAKLAVVYLLMVVGWALSLRGITRRATVPIT